MLCLAHRDGLMGFLLSWGESSGFLSPLKVRFHGPPWWAPRCQKGHLSVHKGLHCFASRMKLHCQSKTSFRRCSLRGFQCSVGPMLCYQLSWKKQLPGCKNPVWYEDHKHPDHVIKYTANVHCCSSTKLCFRRKDKRWGCLRSLTSAAERSVTIYLGKHDHDGCLGCW